MNSSYTLYLLPNLVAYPTVFSPVDFLVEDEIGDQNPQSSFTEPCILNMTTNNFVFDQYAQICSAGATLLPSRRPTSSRVFGKFYETSEILLFSV